MSCVYNLCGQCSPLSNIFYWNLFESVNASVFEESWICQPARILDVADIPSHVLFLMCEIRWLKRMIKYMMNVCMEKSRNELCFFKYPDNSFFRGVSFVVCRFVKCMGPSDRGSPMTISLASGFCRGLVQGEKTCANRASVQRV